MDYVINALYEEFGTSEIFNALYEEFGTSEIFYAATPNRSSIYNSKKMERREERIFMVGHAMCTKGY